MKIIIRCTNHQQAEILSKDTLPQVSLIFTGNDINVFNTTDGDVFFDLIADEHNLNNIKKDSIVFVNAVINTCNEIPENCIRINAWNGFLQRAIIEIATNKHQSFVQKTMDALGWKFQFVADEVGMIAPRIIAMIVNEAYFALEDKVSTPSEIDTAMKLGTNYPYGPFEWSEKIGLKKIHLLLLKLSKQDTRYTPCNLLATKANNS